MNTIKLEYRDDNGALRKRWMDNLNEVAGWDALPRDTALTIKRGNREVIVSTADFRTPPGSHSVGYNEGVTSFWQDCGDSLPEALMFAENVFAQGVGAF